MRVCLSRPNINGLPGRMAIFQNDKRHTLRGQHRRDQVVIADRGPADGDQQVCIARLFEMGDKAFRQVAGNAEEFATSAPAASAIAATPR